MWRRPLLFGFPAARLRPTIFAVFVQRLPSFMSSCGVGNVPTPSAALRYAPALRQNAAQDAGEQADRSSKHVSKARTRLKRYGRTATYAWPAREADMTAERLQKSRAFIEAECVKAARAETLCRELEHVKIRRLFPSGTAANWQPAEFDPPLSTVGECMAQKAMSSLADSYTLADGE